eukprot:TRINITY_DN127_c0_g1_i1.p1 TRINITY_DN127_c0_g1~~TRINITY_DN127_c0_g1_i1.p1  ORF type:complete len:438 (-),score=94.49 TRINITY_DN127_c0_g1_i1:1093-2406(-)
MSRLAALFFVLFVALTCSERVKFNDVESGNMLLGSSVSIACGTYQFAGAPQGNKVYLFGEEEAVVNAPQDSNQTFGLALSAHCRDKSPVLVVSAPGAYVAIYTDKKWDKPSLVIPLKEGEGKSVSSDGNFVIYSGNSNSIYIVDIQSGDIQFLNVEVPDMIKRNFAFCLSIKESQQDVVVLIGSPGVLVANASSNSTYRTSGSTILLKGTRNNEIWTFQTLMSLVKEKESFFGQSVTLSHDAKFGLIGSPEIYNMSDKLVKPKGAVYVIEEVDGTWKEGNKLNGEDFVFYNLFGLVVSLPESDNSYASIGSLSLKGQMRIFVLKMNSTDISPKDLYNTLETGLSIKALSANTPDFYNFKNYSISMTSEVIVAGTTAYSDSTLFSEEGAVFSFSTTQIPFPNWGVSIIGFAGLFIVGAISGMIYAITNPKQTPGYKKI